MRKFSLILLLVSTLQAQDIIDPPSVLSEIKSVLPNSATYNFN